MKYRLSFFVSVLLFMTVALTAQPTVHSLKADYKVNPLGIDHAFPRLSWIIGSTTPNTLQEYYEVRAALDPDDLNRGRRLLWETGKVLSPQSILVPYSGPPVGSFQHVYWQVRIGDNHGKTSRWSEVASWETGFLPDAAWEAEWITSTWDEDTMVSIPSPYLRKEFQLEKPVREARLYITSHGLYQVELNGVRVGDQEFTPGWTSYNTRLQYQTYEVTDQLQRDRNAIGIILGDGWFRGNLGWVDNRNHWGSRLAALAELRVTYTDGTVAVFGTDGSWGASKGPILESDIYNGEVYDANLELTGWSSTGYDDSGWTGVATLDIPFEKLISPEGPPVRIVNELEPLSIEKVGQDWRVDMGQNMVGWIRLRASGKQGDTVVLRHAEVLDKEGNMYYENLRAARATDTYILRGDGEEVLEPHFTFQGFRYVQISGYPGELTADRIRGMVIHSDMEAAGTFTCSDPLINQLQHNILWGLKGNFLDVPTDCPQRDERLGWTGDAQVFIRTACFNMNVAAFFTKWLRDLSTDQGSNGSVSHVVPDVIAVTGPGELDSAGNSGAAAWGDAAVICPWTIYQCYGDTRLLEEQYDSMRGWVEYMRSRAGDDYIWRNDFQFGDWLDYRGTDDRLPTPVSNYELIATAFFAHSARLLSEAALVLDRSNDAKCYVDLAQKVRAAFNEEFVTPAGRVGSGTQTAYVLALHFDLLPESVHPSAAKRLAQEIRQSGYHLTTGFVGTPYLCHVLSQNGYTDIAYELLNQEDSPSWLYPIKRGATTIWERWDGIKPDGTFQDPGMNSFNHYAYGAIGEWLYRVVAGIEIDPDVPGYKRVLFQPRPGGGLSYAKATLESMYGHIESNWTLGKDLFQLAVTIPANSEGIVRLPVMEIDDVTVNGQAVTQLEGVREIEHNEGQMVVTVGSGRYDFQVKLEQLQAAVLTP